MHNLFDDQHAFVEQIREQLRLGFKSILGVASPAFGKTVVAGHIISAARRKAESKAWFLVHRKNLLRQTSKSFWQAHIEHGLITSGKRKSNLPIQVGTIGSVYSRMSNLKAPDILFVDEAHLAKGNMFESVINWAKESGAIVIGLTGTPERLDGKSLGDVFEVMVEAISTYELIRIGRLSTYDVYSTGVVPDLSGVRKSGNDYNKEQLAASMMSDRQIVGDVVEHWRRYANGMRTVCYCVNVKHSKSTRDYFMQAGIPAVHVDADTTESELKDACEGLADGRYKILCNCELVIEGFDLASQIGRDLTLECVILLRPTQSLARYLQMVFRALRRKATAAIILDHAGCVMQHGLPDEERVWSLTGREKGKRKSKDEEPDVNVQQCLKCYAIFRPGPGVCPKCGEIIQKRAVRELQQTDGELVKIDLEAVRKDKRKEQGQARTIRDLILLGIDRGMKKPSAWAAITLASRDGKKPTALDFQAAKRIYNEVLNESRN